MPKYVPMLEVKGSCIMPSNLGTYFGNNMDNTILFYK